MVSRARQIHGSASQQSDAELDAILLENFPGRTLEEIDQMDWARYLRAMQARHIMQVEKRRLALLRGDIKTMSPDEWAMIAEHEELLKQWPTE